MFTLTIRSGVNALCQRLEEMIVKHRVLHANQRLQVTVIRPQFDNHVHEIIGGRPLTQRAQPVHHDLDRGFLGFHFLHRFLTHCRKLQQAFAHLQGLLGHIGPPRLTSVLSSQRDHFQEFHIDLVVKLVDQSRQIGVIRLQEGLHQPELRALRFQHFGCDTVRTKHGFDEALHAEHRTRLEHVPASLFGGGVIHYGFNQLPDHAFLLVLVQPQFNRDIHQKQLFFGVVVQHGRSQRDTIAAVRASAHVGLA